VGLVGRIKRLMRHYKVRHSIGRCFDFYSRRPPFKLLTAALDQAYFNSQLIHMAAEFLF
jgi:hypothetical protein